MRIFKVIRKQDESGISGTGHVIDGVVFDDGTTVIKWRSEFSSIAIYRSYLEFKHLHIDCHPSNETEFIIV